MRLRSDAPEKEQEDMWAPSAAMGLHVRLTLGVFLKRGLAPQANPGPLWSVQECQATPHGQSHLAADEERMQHGHFSCVQATPFTKVLLAASLSFWHVGRGHCNMSEMGVGDKSPVPSEHDVSCFNLRSSFSARAAVRIECSGGSQGQFWGIRKEVGIALLFLGFLPGLFKRRS